MNKLTPEQQKAVDARGCDVLVTASAGTGKTSVLTERCISLLTDRGAGVSVNEMLIMTFTKAAAEEMRARIASGLRRTHDSHPEYNLGRQLIWLDAAHIGTIHSFCQKLVREYFHKLDIDPTFGVIDEDRQRLLKSQALQETIDWAWQQPNLIDPLRELFAGRNVHSRQNSFLDQILRISAFLDGVVDREDWCRRAAAANDLKGPEAQAVITGQKHLLLKRLKACRSRFEFAMMLDQTLAKGHWSEKIMQLRITPIDMCIKMLEDGDINGAAAVIRQHKENSQGLGNRPKDLPEETKDLIFKPIEKTKEDFTGLLDTAILNDTYTNDIGPAVNRQTMTLIELVKRFDYLYQQAKRQSNCLDYADLEHKALKLLGGLSGPSEIAGNLRSRYKAILVDEYQDINSVQKQIITLLSRGGNVFAVGDVKQSIYAFRGASPEIFLGDLKTVLSAPQRAIRVDLTCNFRSRQEVLDVVNAVFSRIMTAEISGLDYDEKAMLKAQFLYKPRTDDSTAVELHLLEYISGKKKKSGDTDENQSDNDINPREKVSREQLQAAVIAERIKRMVGANGQNAEFEIFDKAGGLYRRVTYKDIVILMRSMNAANAYAEVLSLAGIPVHSQSATGYFEATEVTDILSLLKVLDNPRGDIELAAVLRSPLFSFTDDELLTIRLIDNNEKTNRLSGYYECVLKYITSGNDISLRDRLSATLRRLNEWRHLADCSGIASMLWHVYRQTGYLSFVSALPKGRQRRANLLDLHSRAVQFEESGGTSERGIAAFVEFIEKLIDEKGDYSPADVLAPGENVVRIMSVHKSKGLEFPVVFLAEIEKQFNMEDIKADCLLDESMTLGLTVIDARQNRSQSMVSQLIQAKKKAASLAEEMRILYVALTRARERLVITSDVSLESCRRQLRYGSYIQNDAIPTWMLESCRSSLEWIIYGLSRQPAMHRLLNTGCPRDMLDKKELVAARIIDIRQQDDLAAYISAMKDSVRKSDSDVKRDKDINHDSGIQAAIDNILWEYPHQAAVRTCAKTSVTLLTHRDNEFRPVMNVIPEEHFLISTKTGHTGDQDPARIGTATHLVLQSLDISSPCDEQAVKARITAIVNEGLINNELAAAIDAAGIAAFFRTKLGCLVKSNHNHVKREWPFTFAMPLREYGTSASSAAETDKVIVQGIVDMLLRQQDKVIIIDFKTDHIRPADVPSRANLYAAQLSIYSRAAQAILGLEHIEKWIYFISPRQLVQLH